MARRRILSVWFPHFPMERLGQQTAARPIALVESVASGVRLAAVNRAAQQAGAAPGMRLTDARAVQPGLQTLPLNARADAAMLGRLADWMTRYAPWTAVDGGDGLLIDTDGSAHLWGGEAPMLEDIRHRLRMAGYEVRLGLADTIGAAWGAARFLAKARALIQPGETRAALANAPVAALRLEEKTETALRGLGLRRIGELLALPREALARRFRAAGPGHCAGEALLARLDQLSGARDEPLTPRHAAPDRRVRIAPTEPLIDPEGITRAFDGLLDDLLTSLARDDLGALHLALTAYRGDGWVIRKQAAFARPNRDPDHIRRLFSDRIPEIDPGHGIDMLSLSAERTGPLKPVQRNLEDGGDAACDDLAKLVDRLGNRLGAQAVSRLQPVESHRPERAERRAAAVERSAWPMAPDEVRRRPAMILERPETVDVVAEIPEGPPLSFRWRRVLHRVARARGPERICPEWWRGQGDRTRDYYEVEDAQGRRFWLFRDGQYDDPMDLGAPVWRMHGIFT